MTLPARLKALRTSLGLTQEQMAARFRISRNYYWQLENGTKPGGPKFQREVETLEQTLTRVSAPTASDIMRDVQITVPRYIPVLTLAEAGNVLVAWENFPLHFAQKVPTDLGDPQAFAVRVQGDSMEPYFFEGDHLIVSPADEIHDADLVVVRLAGGGTVFKQYHEVDQGRGVRLTSFNAAYPARTYPRGEIECLVRVVSRLQDVRVDRSRRRF